MKRFWRDLTSHYRYAIYSAKSELKSEVANSYLNWMVGIRAILFHADLCIYFWCCV